MKRLLLLGTCLSLPLFVCFADQEDFQLEPELELVSEPVQARIPALSLRVDPVSAEQQQAGLTAEMLQEAVTKEILAVAIPIDEQVSLPSLVLKVRSIQVGLDVATFFQLSLFEKSMLVRNRAMFNATTWSQTALLSCPPEKLKKEILETVSLMSQNFAREYLKAHQTT